VGGDVDSALEYCWRRCIAGGKVRLVGRSERKQRGEAREAGAGVSC
jgi:hypothetical protein